MSDDAMPSGDAAGAPESPPEGERVRIVVRAEKQKRRDGTAFTGAPCRAFAEALEAPGDWIEWAGVDALATLDVDFHGIDAPRWGAQLARYQTLPVVPLATWRSHGGGAHLIFLAVDGFTAGELASSAAVELASAFELREARFEVLPRTRHPGSVRNGKRAGPVRWTEPAILGDVIQAWGRDHGPDITALDVEEYKAERGWSGRRDAPHNECPFDPGHKSHSDRPVFLGDAGVSCQSCKGRGLRHYASWADLIGGGSFTPPVREMARSLVDWTHAALILSEDYQGRISPAVLRRAYYALCKLIHGTDDPRIGRLSRNRSGDFVRGVGCWLDPIDLRPARVSRRYHQTQPGFLYVTRKEVKGQVRLETSIDQTAVERAQNDGGIPGWFPIVPVRGVKLWGAYNTYPGLTHARRVSVFRDLDRSAPPRYVPGSSRMPMDAAWAEMETRFPGLDRAYLELLIVARGYAESGAGRVPRLLVTGPSGSAKSTTVRLASAIVGDVCRAIPYTASFRERFDTAVSEAGFLLCDEFAKPARAKSGKRRVDEGPGFAFFLDMEDRAYSARLIYIGPVQLRLDSVVIVTGTGFPPAILEDLQIARRFIHIHLTQRTPGPWEETCGFSDVANTRRYLPDICDAIVSDIIDRYFVLPDPGRASFERAAMSLGFRSLEATINAGIRDVESLDGVDPFSALGLVRRFFELLCSAADCGEPPARLAAKGRRKFGVFDETEIARTWRELADDVADPAGRHRSERIDELDLCAALGLGPQLPELPIRLEVKGDHQTICARFIAGPLGRAPRLVNEEISEFYQSHQPNRKE